MLPAVGDIRQNSWQEIEHSESFQHQLRDIAAKKCHCTHNCAMFDSILFNPTHLPHLIYQYVA
jgi:hypothetical protein